MAMKETPNSLRAYFILIGLLAIGGAVLNIVNYGTGLLLLVINVVSIALGLGLIGVGAMTPKLLQSAPPVLHVTVWINVAWHLIMYGLVLAGGSAETQNHIQALVALAIAIYLSVNIRRLSTAGPATG